MHVLLLNYAGIPVSFFIQGMNRATFVKYAKGLGNDAHFFIPCETIPIWTPFIKSGPPESP